MGFISQREREESREMMLGKRERRGGEGGERTGACDCIIYLRIACRSERRRGGGVGGLYCNRLSLSIFA